MIEKTRGIIPSDLWRIYRVDLLTRTVSGGGQLELPRCGDGGGDAIPARAQICDAIPARPERTPRVGHAQSWGAP